MATLKKTTINDTGFLKIASGNQGQASANPAEGDIRFDTTENSIKISTPSASFEKFQTVRRARIGTSEKNPATSAQAILNAFPGAPSGVYYIQWGGTVYPIWCEMKLQGGGWMMVLNYNRAANTNPNLLVRSSSFPIMGNEFGYDDESGETGNFGSWGHISNSLANAYNWSEYMFYGKTTDHNRVIHFYGNNTNIVSYIKTGSGAMVPHYADTATNFNGELYNNASIPLFVNSDRSGYSNQGDSAMTEFPIYGNSTIGNPRAHWGIRGGGQRWEVDNSPGSVPNVDTIHRIWVR